MSEKIKPEIGAITWTDLTVPDADDVRDFYSEIVGWKFEPVDMGGYNDYNMISPSTGNTNVGICHARGVNASLPPQWLVYITVEDVDKSAAKCIELGGKIIMEPKKMAGYGRYCVIQDIAGAVAALFTPENS
jgi:predicted enzyme related to lactoylglutathione lyase